jgi:hypothetical protein
LLVANAAQAVSITILPDNCDSCAGLTLGLEANQMGDDVEVFLSYSAPDLWSGDPDWASYTVITQAGFKAAKFFDSSDIILHSIKVDGVDISSTAFAEWDSKVTEANNNSSDPFCTKGTSSDKVCTYAKTDGGSIDLAGGGELVFEFWIEDATLMTDRLDLHIGGQLCDDRADPTTCEGHIISESVPEPSAALLFGIGSLLVGARLRSRS